jgi:hypothetical protein
MFIAAPDSGCSWHGGKHRPAAGHQADSPEHGPAPVEIERVFRPLIGYRYSLLHKGVVVQFLYDRVGNVGARDL